MSTAIVNNNALATNNMVKPQMVPGETVVTQTTVTQTLAPAFVPESKGFAIFSSVFGALSALGWWLGSVLNLTAMALALRDSSFYYTPIGGLLVAGFSLWFIASLLNWVPNFGGFAKVGPNGARDGYHIFNLFANLLAAISMALFITGAACWLSGFNNVRYHGTIVWIVAASLWLISLIIRDMGLRYDAMRTYRDYPILPTTATANNTDNNVAKARGARISSLWGNAIATDLYLVSSVLFLLGAIFWVCRENNYNINGYTAGKFENAASILWIVGSSMVFFAALAHCVARR
jgi:hypothetical protein